jgi:hypothetical protein
VGKVKRQLSYANVMATLAVFIALGGGAYAVTAGKNTVTSKSIRTGAVKSEDVQNYGLKAIDIDPLTLSGLQGPAGPPGPTAAAVFQSGANPVSNPDLPDPGADATVNAPTAGRLLVLWDGDIFENCTAGDPSFGLYVDGLPVPNTRIDWPTGTTKNVNLRGIIQVAAGSHKLTGGFDCPSGNHAGGSFGNVAPVAIFLAG